MQSAERWLNMKMNTNIKTFLNNFDKYYNQKNSKKNKLSLQKDFKKIRKKFIDNNNYFLIIKNFESNIKKIKDKSIVFSEIIGTRLAQSKKGNKIQEVTPKISKLKKISKKKIKEKLRYHQTNLGGSIHSDGPQLNQPPKYIIMTCVQNAKKGGLSIITNAKKIFEFMKKKEPKHLRVLKKSFFFERRGFSFNNSNIFKKPIFEIKKNLLRFRYLREYIESGYKIKGKIINSEQLNALSYLDKALTNKKFKTQYKLQDGDLIIINNNILAHGRSGFKLENKKARSFLRIWVK